VVDTRAYKRPFPSSRVAELRLRDDIGIVAMASDEPPKVNELLVFPPAIVAYDLQQKVWRELYIDWITDIDWNKQAFKDFVIEPETKELV
jgi:hypothetical protein